MQARSLRLATTRSQNALLQKRGCLVYRGRNRAYDQLSVGGNAMKLHRRQVLQWAAGAVALHKISPAFSQTKFPERPIRLVIPFPPGGVYDTVGRPLAEQMKPSLGTIVVENQGGAGGSVAFASVARSRPDGYTIILGGLPPIVITAVATSRPLYDPVKDLDPIVMVGGAGQAIAIHPALPIQSLNEFIAYSKLHPGKLSYATAGVGTLNHMTGELFKSLIGNTDIVHVPYRGAGPATLDLISGHVPMGVFAVTGQLLELHKTGKLRILAITTPERIAAAPDIPTAVEAGLPGLIAQTAIGLFAPAGTPKSIIAQIAEATRAAIRDQAFKERLEADGIQPFTDSSPEKMRQALAEEFARWTPIIKSIGFKLD